MSALPPKADMCGANRHVCFGPIADIGSAPRWEGGRPPTEAAYHLFRSTRSAISRHS